jgi:hypothetical protein
MKKLICSLMFGFLSLGIFANPIVPADTMRIDGKLVLWLLVPGYESGYEYGRLLGPSISEVMEDYVINQTFGGAYGYQAARQIFEDHFVYDEKYQVIAQGMLDGMEQNGVSIYSPTLGENLNFKDVLIANSIPDFTAFSDFGIRGPGCSDLMSWGEATQNSSLGGELVISRNLDWDNDPLLIENALMIIWGSAEGQRIITFGFTGLIGALSGFNESGIVTFQNMGNHYMSPTGTDFYPVNLAQRDGLESWDYNQDGVCSPRDVTDAVRAHNVASTFIVNTAGPNNFDVPAEILEIHNSIGEEIRTVDENLFNLGTNLVSTNHFRRLMPPAYCYRYNRFVDSLELSPDMSMNRNWSVLKAGGVNTNLQTIQYIPYQHLLRFSFAEIGSPAYLNDPTEILVDSLFSLVGIKKFSSVKNKYTNIYPNPCQEETFVSIKSPGNGVLQLHIFDCRGNIVYQNEIDGIRGNSTTHKINLNSYESGIYYCKVSLQKNGEKVFSETSKIVVSR